MRLQVQTGTSNLGRNIPYNRAILDAASTDVYPYQLET